MSLAGALDVAGATHELVKAIGSTSSRAALIEKSLDLLLEAGFSRTRYFAVDANVAGRGHVLVLTKETARDPETSPGRIGYDIDLTALHPRIDFPVISDAIDTDGNVPGWVRELGLAGRRWVDIPIPCSGPSSGALLAGVIQSDWQSYASSLSESDLATLAIFGRLVGSFVSSDSVATTFSIPDQEATSPHSFVATACDSLVEDLEAAVGAVFEYQWHTGRLVKIHERLHPNLASAQSIPEDYSIREKLLTPLAWRDEEYRYIQDFSRLRELHPGIADASEILDHHRHTIGMPLKTILYTVLGSRTKRFLLRFINRVDAPSLPFLARRQKLAASGLTLSSAVDGLVAAARLRSLGRLARKAVENVTQPAEVVSSLALALKEEGVVSFVVMAHSEGSTRLRFARPFGAEFAGWQADQTAKWLDDHVYASAQSAKPGSVIPVTRPNGTPSGVTARLLSRDVEAAIVFPVEAGETRGVLLIPVARGDHLGGSRKDDDRAKIVDNAANVVLAYFEVVVNAIESRRLHMSSQGARHALGFMGHEIRTPLASLGEGAISALFEAREAVELIQKEGPKAADFLRAKFRRRFHDLQDRRGEIDRLLFLGPIVADIGSGRMQMHFKRERVASLVEQAQIRLRSETQGVQIAMHGGDLESAGKPYVLDIAQGLQRLPQIACDRILIQQALMILLQNAVKYSLPRKPREPMTIKVTGRRVNEGTLAINISNWGFGIRPDQMEDIFDPFVRGDIEDEKKAVRGLGLGLYLARHIAIAHQGSLDCVRSEATLDDPKRREALEGFETEFELRLRTDLDEGPRAFQWERRIDL